MTIRTVTKKDNLKLYRLITQQSEKSEETIRAGTYFNTWLPVFENMLQSNWLKIFVAENSDQEIVGVTTVYLLLRLELAGRYAVIEDVYVKEEERSKGIGSTLIKHIISFLNTENIQCISATIDPENNKVKNFYNQLGFKPNASEVRINLKPQT